MKLHKLKHIFSSDLSSWPVESNFDSSDIFFAKKLTLNIGKRLSKFFKIRFFIFPQSFLWTSWLQFWIPRGKHLPSSENVLFIRLQKTPPFVSFLFYKRSSGHVEFSVDKPDGNFLPNVVFYRSKFQMNFEMSLFWKKIFSKRILWKRRMKGSLDNPAENCSSEVRKLFDRSGKKT